MSLELQALHQFAMRVRKVVNEAENEWVLESQDIPYSYRVKITKIFNRLTRQIGQIGEDLLATCEEHKTLE